MIPKLQNDSIDAIEARMRLEAAISAKTFNFVFDNSPPKKDDSRSYINHRCVRDIGRFKEDAIEMFLRELF